MWVMVGTGVNSSLHVSYCVSKAVLYNKVQDIEAFGNQDDSDGFRYNLYQ